MKIALPAPAHILLLCAALLWWAAPPAAPAAARDPRGFPADALALDSADRPVFIADSADDAVTLWRCDAPDCANHTSITLPAPGIGDAATARLALSRRDHPVLAYISAAQRLMLLVCEDPLCAAASHNVIDGLLPPQALSALALALDSVDYPVLVYHDSQAAGVKLAYCHDRRCQARRLTLIAPGPAPQAMVMHLSPRDAPLVALRDADATLQLILCDSLLCEAPLVRTPDAGRAISDFSLIVSPQGAPLVAYAGQADQRLYLALCDAAACRSPILVPAAPDAAVTGPPLLSLSPQGLPMVFFGGGSPAALTALICADAACANTTRTTLTEAPTLTGLAQSYDASGRDVLLLRQETGAALVRCADGRCTAAAVLPIAR